MGDYDFLSEPSEASANPYQAPVETRATKRKSRGTKDIPWACEYSSASTWAKIVVVSFGMIALTSIASIVIHITTMDDLAGMIRRGQATQAEVQSLMLKLGAPAVLGGLAYCIVGILFIVWFRKSYKNLPALGAKKLDHGLGWTIGGWFVPILFLVRPYQIASDIWIYSCPKALKAGMKTVRSISKTPVLMWWLAFLAMEIFGRVAGIGQNSTTQMQALRATRDATQMTIVYNVIQLVAAGLCVNFILTVARWQDERYKLVCQLAEETPVEAPSSEPNPFENYS